MPIPPWLIGAGIRVVIALVFFAAIAFAVHKYNDWVRAPVIAACEADKVALRQRVTDITNTLSNKLMEAMDHAKAADAKREATFSDMGKRAVALGGSPVAFPAGTDILLDDAIRAANSHGDNSGGSGPAATVPVSTEAGEVIYNSGDWNKFAVDAANSYTSAYDKWAQCRVREDNLRSAIKQGVTP